MSQYFIDKLVYNKDTLDIHDTGAREMIANNTTNIQAVSARVTKNANDIDALEEITTDLREDVDNLDDRMGVAETEIDGLKTRTTNLEGRMNTAENRLDGHDTKISDLEDRMDTAENNIIALDGRMTAAENDIDAAEHRLDLVEAKNDEQDIAIDDLEENVAKNTADIVDIKDDLTGVHENIEDLDDRIAASTYEAGIGIYFGQGVEHTNINVEDEILDQINQNTIDIQNLKTRVTNVENRLTTVEGDIVNIKGDIVNIKGDITDIKAEITNIKADITALDARVTALEQKALPAGGVKGQILKKKSDTDYDVEWGDIETPIYDYTAGDTFVEPIGINCHMRFHHITASDTFWDTTNLGYYIPVNVAKAVGITTASYIDVEQKLFFDDADNKAYYYYTCKFVYSLSDRPDCILVFTGRRTATSSINWVLESSTGLDIGRLVLINDTPNFYAETYWYPLLNVLVHNYKLRNVSIRVNNYHVPAGTTAKLTSYDVPIRIYMDGAFGKGCGFTTTFTNMDTSTLYSVNFEYDYATSTWTPTYKSVALT